MDSKPSIVWCRMFSLSHPHVKGYLALITTVAIWAAFAIFARVGTTGALLPTDQIALRIATSGCLVGIPYLALTGNWRKLGDGRYWLVGIIGGLGYSAFVFFGFAHSPVAHSPVWLYGLLPLFSALLGWHFFGLPLNRNTLVSLAVLLAGIISMLAIMRYRQVWSLTIGDLFFVIAAVCWALYSLLIQKWQLPAIPTTLCSLVIATVLYMPLYCTVLPSHLLQAPVLEVAMYAAFQGVIVSLIAMLTYLYAIETIGLVTCVVWLSLSPLIASIIAVYAINEPISPEALVGIVFACVAALKPWQWHSSTRQC